jgi:mRNA interferase MazF
MVRILRGDIIWANLDPTQGHEQAGKRPVLVLSHDIFNAKSNTVIALALTTQPQRAGFPLTFELEGLNFSKPVWVKISQIRTLSVQRLGSKIGHVSSDQLAEILVGLDEIIGSS